MPDIQSKGARHEKKSRSTVIRGINQETALEVSETTAQEDGRIQTTGLKHTCLGRERKV